MASISNSSQLWSSSYGNYGSSTSGPSGASGASGAGSAGATGSAGAASGAGAPSGATPNNQVSQQVYYMLPPGFAKKHPCPKGFYGKDIEPISGYGSCSLGYELGSLGSAGNVLRGKMDSSALREALYNNAWLQELYPGLPEQLLSDPEVKQRGQDEMQSYMRAEGVLDYGGRMNPDAVVRLHRSGAGADRKFTVQFDAYGFTLVATLEYEIEYDGSRPVRAGIDRLDNIGLRILA